MKRFFALMIALLLLFSLTSCTQIEGLINRLTQDYYQDYTVEDTLVITLPIYFEEKDITDLGFSTFLASPTAVLLITKVAAPDGYTTPLEYGAYLAEQDNASGGVQHDEKNGLVYYIFNSPHLGMSVRYIYLHNGMFWLIDMSNGSDNVEDQMEDYEKWAKSVTFTE